MRPGRFQAPRERRRRTPGRPTRSPGLYGLEGVSRGARIAPPPPTPRELERRVKGEDPRARPVAEGGATRRKAGAGKVLLAALVSGAAVMLVYVATGGFTALLPQANPHDALARGVSSTAPHAALASATHAAAATQRAGIRAPHRTVRAAQAAREASGSAAVPAGYLGPRTNFTPGPDETTGEWWAKALGAWQAAAAAATERLDAAGYGDLREKVTEGVSQFVDTLSDIATNSLSGFGGAGGSNTEVFGIAMPVMAGVGAFAAVLVLCFLVAAFVSMRGSRSEHGQVFRTGQRL
jgi:hypothetical protein